MPASLLTAANRIALTASAAWRSKQPATAIEHQRANRFHGIALDNNPLAP
jgi:hypothetical protein